MSDIAIAPEIESRPKRKLNLRMLAFVGIFAVLLGVPVYLYLDALLTGGIKQRGDVYEVNLKAMSSFVFDQQFGVTADVPEKWRALDGKKVVLVGEVTPDGFSARGLDRYFQLVYSVTACCFSGPPQIQHFVQCTVPPHVNINYAGGATRVTGTLTVDVRRDENGTITGVYHVLVDSVEPVM